MVPYSMGVLLVEYRHGTTSLIGFFDVATGRMEQPY